MYEIAVPTRYFPKRKYREVLGVRVIHSVIAPNKREAARGACEHFGFKRLPPGSTVKWITRPRCRCRRCKGAR